MTDKKSTFESIEGGAYVVSWEEVIDGDICLPTRFAGAPDRTVEVDGTFDGATVYIEGTLVDGGAYKTLTDPQGNSLVFSTSGIEMIAENVRFIRPRVSGTTVNTSLNIHILMGGR